MLRRLPVPSVRVRLGVVFSLLTFLLADYIPKPMFVGRDGIIAVRRNVEYRAMYLSEKALLEPQRRREHKDSKKEPTLFFTIDEEILGVSAVQNIN